MANYFVCERAHGSWGFAGFQPPGCLTFDFAEQFRKRKWRRQFRKRVRGSTVWQAGCSFAIAYSCELHTSD